MKRYEHSAMTATQRSNGLRATTANETPYAIISCGLTTYEND